MLRIAIIFLIGASTQCLIRSSMSTLVFLNISELENRKEYICMFLE